MVDRPHPVDPKWLNMVEDVFGEYQLVPMTATGEQGIVCRMRIDPDNLVHLRQLPAGRGSAITRALGPLLDELPKPYFALKWNEDRQAWVSEIPLKTELPQGVRDVFKNTGYGSLALETDMGVVHVCHAADPDIEGFADKSVISRWQLIKMPSAPLVRLTLTILDRPEEPYRFESFLNVAEKDQFDILVRLANQRRLYLSFYGDDLNYRYTKILEHDEQQWQLINDLTTEALDHLSKIPPEKRNYDRAKGDFMRRFV